MRIASLFVVLTLSSVGFAADPPNYEELFKDAGFDSTRTAKTEYDEYANLKNRCNVAKNPDLTYCRNYAKSDKEGKTTSFPGQCAKTILEYGKAVDDEVGKLKNQTDIATNSQKLWTALDTSAQVHEQSAKVCEQCHDRCKEVCTIDMCKDKTQKDQVDCIKEVTAYKEICEKETAAYASAEKANGEQARKDEAAALGTHNQAQADKETPPNNDGGTEQAPADTAGTQQPSSTPANNSAQSGQAAGAGAQAMQDLFKKDEEKEKEDTADEEDTAEDEQLVVDCAADKDAGMFSECRARVIDSCTADPNNLQCPLAKTNYCGSQADPTKMDEKTKAFCASSATSTASLCTTEWKKANCPSCTSAGANMSVDQAVKVKAGCDGSDGAAADPYYSSAAFSQATGGGGGLAASPLAGTQPVVQQSVPGDESNREGLSMGVDSAGGGYSSPGGTGIYGDDSSPFSSKGGKGARSMASSAASGIVPMSVTDVGTNQFGNVFSIGSEVIRIRCLQGKFLHCAPGQ